MAIRVKTSHGIVEFPDGTSEEEMAGALRQLDAPAPPEGSRDARYNMDVQESPVTKEPDNWWGGFLHDIDKQMHEMGGAMFESAARPKTMGDFLGLLLPNTVSGQARSATAGAINDLPGRSGQAFKAAARRTNMGGGIANDAKELVTFPFKAAREFNDALPSVSAKQSLEFRGPKETPAPRPQVQSRSGTPDLIDKYLRPDAPVNDIGVDPFKPNTSGYNPSAPPSRNTTLKVGDGPIADPYMPNTSGAPDGGIPQGEMVRPVEVDPHMPNTGGVPDGGLDDEFMNLSGPEVDRYMPNSGGQPTHPSPTTTDRVPYAPESPSPQGTSPIESGTIDDMLQELMQTDAAPDSRITGIPPESELVGGGPFKQSGKFPKSEQVGQPGGYSSGNPGMGDSQMDSLLEKFGGREGLGTDAAPTHPVGGTPTSDAVPSIDDFMLEELNPGRMAGQAQELRRNVGSRDAAREMFGTANPQTQDAIRTMAPGPSQIPLTAEERIRKAAEEVMRQMGLGGERR